MGTLLGNLELARLDKPAKCVSALKIFFYARIFCYNAYILYANNDTCVWMVSHDDIFPLCSDNCQKHGHSIREMLQLYYLLAFLTYSYVDHNTFYLLTVRMSIEIIWPNIATKHDIIVQVNELIGQTGNTMQMTFNCWRRKCRQVTFIRK